MTQENEDIVDAARKELTGAAQTSAVASAQEGIPETGPAEVSTGVAPKSCPKRRRMWRICFWSLGCSGGVVLLVVALLAYIIGREMAVPDWIHTRLETRLSQMVPTGQVQFADLSVELGSGLRPRVALQGVEIVDGDGRRVVALDELEVRLATDPLFQGQLRLGRVRATGVEMFVRRRADGSFDIAFGENLPEVGTGASPTQIIAQIDQLLESPELRHLNAVTADGVILRYEDARVGRAWTVDGGRADLTREGDALRLRGDMSLLGGHAYVTTIETSFSSTVGETAAQFGMRFEDMAGPDIAVQSAAVAWLEAVQAPISGALRGSLNADGSLGPISGTLQSDAGVVQPTPETKPVPFRAARSYFTFDPANQTLRFDELSVDSSWVSLRAEGETTLRGLENGLPQGFEGQFRLSELSAAPAGLLPEPIAVDQAAMSFRLMLDPFELSLGEVVLKSGAQSLVASGRAAAIDGGWDLSLSAQADSLDLPSIISGWPAELKPKSRKWVVENIKEAVLTNGHFALRKVGDAPHEMLASFEFSDTLLRYSPLLPFVEAGRGHAVLEGNRFTAVADGGHVTAPEGGTLDVSGTTFVIPDIRIKPAPAEVNLVAEGPLTAALSYLNLPPLSVLDKAERGLDLAQGYVAAKGQLRLPLRKKLPPEMVRYDIDALLVDVVSDTLVPGRRLQADRLELAVNNDRLVITGPGTVEGVGFDAVYESGMRKKDRGRAQVYGTVDISQKALDAFNISLPKGTLRGLGEGRMTIALQKGKPPQFELTSDLAGIGLSLPPLGWSLSQSRTGAFSVRGALSKPARIDRITLDAPGLTASGRLTINGAGALETLALDRVRVGGWLDAPVTLSGRGKGRSPAVRVDGGRLDLRNRPKSVTAGGATAGTTGTTPITGRLDEVRISDTIALTGVQGEFTAGSGLNGRFTARVNGAARIEGDVSSIGKRAAYEVRSDDAGGVFKAAGLLKQARDGDMVLRLTPAGPEGQYDGHLTVSNTRVIEVPALASLLHAVSVVGVLEQMASGGIMFSDAEAFFRLTPDRLILQRASAVGASMGLSIDGVYDLKARQMDFQGVLSPVYMLNGIGSILTRKGEGLIGFNYRLTGAGDKPRVQVNPLSLFTPGMFREIFRRPPPAVDQ